MKKRVESINRLYPFLCGLAVHRRVMRHDAFGFFNREWIDVAGNTVLQAGVCCRKVNRIIRFLSTQNSVQNSGSKRVSSADSIDDVVDVVYFGVIRQPLHPHGSLQRVVCRGNDVTDGGINHLDVREHLVNLFIVIIQFITDAFFDFRDAQ